MATMVIEADMERAQALHRTILTAGWLAGVVQRAKRVPPLNRVLGDPERARPKRAPKPRAKLREDYQALVRELG